ncbi:uncharacterized protein B0H18DRAFT_952860 [Fomitopsis serialis]|uniref:uncharacterized protein n=1 Tax=Fomitopsis serialis TaxID=139415 RepID=UPI002007956B|nr:uncharacterized protein B0H18DRAFT_952860 [Neoantrodia serialis]KAH9931370.1 hypothetical protein B0H18DRAFT_952860 [Neoantrodia serialis]
MAPLFRQKIAPSAAIVETVNASHSEPAVDDQHAPEPQRVALPQTNQPEHLTGGVAVTSSSADEVPTVHDGKAASGEEEPPKDPHANLESVDAPDPQLQVQPHPTRDVGITANAAVSPTTRDDSAGADEAHVADEDVHQGGDTVNTNAPLLDIDSDTGARDGAASTKVRKGRKNTKKPKGKQVDHPNQRKQAPQTDPAPASSATPGQSASRGKKRKEVDAGDQVAEPSTRPKRARAAIASAGPSSTPSGTKDTKDALDSHLKNFARELSQPEVHELVCRHRPFKQLQYDSENVARWVGICTQASCPKARKVQYLSDPVGADERALITRMRDVLQRLRATESARKRYEKKKPATGGNQAAEQDHQLKLYADEERRLHAQRTQLDREARNFSLQDVIDVEESSDEESENSASYWEALDGPLPPPQFKKLPRSEPRPSAPVVQPQNDSDDDPSIGLHEPSSSHSAIPTSSPVRTSSPVDPRPSTSRARSLSLEEALVVVWAYAKDGEPPERSEFDLNAHRVSFTAICTASGLDLMDPIAVWLSPEGKWRYMHVENLIDARFRLRKGDYVVWAKWGLQDLEDLNWLTDNFDYIDDPEWPDPARIWKARKARSSA